MKFLLSLIFLSSFSAYSQTNCVATVAEVCLEQISSDEKLIVSEFLEDETKIANFFENRHISNIKIFKTNSLYQLEKYFVDSSNLKKFIAFATKELGVYKENIDVIESFKDAKFFKNGAEFKKYFRELALDIDEVESTVYSGCDIPFDSIMSSVRNYDKSLNNLLAYLTQSEESFSVYPLADNNNENTQDAQYLIATRNYVILVNQFWFL